MSTILQYMSKTLKECVANKLKPAAPKVSKVLKFYGVCTNTFKLDDIIWEAVEDPSDGYRSMLAELRRVSDVSKLTFAKEPFVEVQCRRATEDDFDGFELFDSAGHVWLKFGTAQASDYYPTFTFEYTPVPKFEAFVGLE